jgi:hypothetical protein
MADVVKACAIHADIKEDETTSSKSSAKQEISLLLLLHDNARLHTALRTQEATAAMGCTFSLIVPYSPDLATSDFLLCWPVKDALRGRRSADDEVKKRLA